MTGESGISVMDDDHAFVYQRGVLAIILHQIYISEKIIALWGLCVTFFLQKTKKILWKIYQLAMGCTTVCASYYVDGRC